MRAAIVFLALGFVMFAAIVAMIADVMFEV